MCWQSLSQNQGEKRIAIEMLEKFFLMCIQEAQFKKIPQDKSTHWAL